jgi:hypothetical protein
LGAFAALDVLRATTDFPPKSANRLDYSKATSYWGDTTGVFRKPLRSPRIRLAVVRGVMKAWSNSVSDLERTKPPT